MANGGKDDNSSQFFITLGPTNDLNKKHTIFGKITGDTIYNMVKMAEGECDHNEKPVNPNYIKTTHVLNNPFDDIVPRNLGNQHTVCFNWLILAIFQFFLVKFFNLFYLTFFVSTENSILCFFFAFMYHFQSILRQNFLFWSIFWPNLTCIFVILSF